VDRRCLCSEDSMDSAVKERGYQMSQETIERLQARIDQLEQQVSQLEKEIQELTKPPVMLLKPPPVAYNIPRKAEKGSIEETEVRSSTSR
jgi:predicted RNase H-like nuclease (RuvC/YqgF family)